MLAAVRATVLPAAVITSATLLSNHVRCDRGHNQALDVVVVGGGVCGLSTALHLAQLGKKVVLCEREVIGGPTQASSINCGFLEQFTTPGPQLFTGKPGDLQHLLLSGTFHIYGNLAERHDIEFRRMGMLIVIEKPKQLRHALKQDLPQVSDLTTGVPISGAIISGPLLKVVEPALSPSISSAIYYPECGSAHPTKTMLALAEEAKAHGVVILEKREVHSISKEDDGTWHVGCHKLKDRTGGEKPGSGLVLKPKQVVIACGGVTPEVVAMVDDEIAMPVTPVVGQMWRTVKTEPLLNNLIASMESSTAWSSRVTRPPNVTHERGKNGWRPRITRHLYGKQTPEGRIVFGGDRRVHPTQSLQSVHCLPRLIDEMHDGCHGHAVEVVPALENLPVEHKWGGIMPFTADGRPIIGPITGYPGLFVCTGLGGSGFMRGAMGGYLLAESMCGDARAKRALKSVTPARFTSEDFAAQHSS